MLTFGDFLVIAAAIACGKVAARLLNDAIDERIECEPDEATSATATIHFSELREMYVVKADHPNVTGRININVADSEGNPLGFDPELVENIDVTSTNPELVNIEVDEDSDSLTFVVSFGRPSNGETDIASVEARITYNGIELAPAGAQFTITTGDPSSVNATIQFDGLTEIPPTEPTEPTEPGV